VQAVASSFGVATCFAGVGEITGSCYAGVIGLATLPVTIDAGVNQFGAAEQYSEN
jgi:hypothetical protein